MKENIEVETIVKGLGSLTPQSREYFLCAIGNINVDKIANHLDCGNSIFSVMKSLEDDKSISVKIKKLIEPLESLLGDLKKMVNK